MNKDTKAQQAIEETGGSRLKQGITRQPALTTSRTSRTRARRQVPVRSLTRMTTAFRQAAVEKRALDPMGSARTLPARIAADAGAVGMNVVRVGPVWQACREGRGMGGLCRLEPTCHP